MRERAELSPRWGAGGGGSLRRYRGAGAIATLGRRGRGVRLPAAALAVSSGPGRGRPGAGGRGAERRAGAAVTFRWAAVGGGENFLLFPVGPTLPASPPAAAMAGPGGARPRPGVRGRRGRRCSGRRALTERCLLTCHVTKAGQERAGGLGELLGRGVCSPDKCAVFPRSVRCVSWNGRGSVQPCARLSLLRLCLWLPQPGLLYTWINATNWTR